jgi:Flp pilus assembly protein TadG
MCVQRESRVMLRDERGASAVEFALVLPVFILIMLGTLCYGLYFGAAHSVQSLAAEAARASIAGMTPDERAALARASIEDSLPNYTLVDGSKVAVAVGPNASDADLFDVSITYDASALPIWQFEGLVPLPSRVIERSAVVRRGGY